MNDQYGSTNEGKENSGYKKDAPNVIGTGGAPKPNESTSNSNCRDPDDRPQSAHARVKYWLEVAGIVFGVVGVICLIVQSWAMVQSNNVFYQQLSEMRRGRIIDERPWNGISTINCDSDYGFTNSWYVVIHYKNFGRTPSFRTIATFDIAFDIKDIREFPEASPTNASEVVVFPGSDIRVVSGPRPISQMIDIWNGKSNCVVYGIIWYNDTSGIHHWTRFRWAYDIKNRVTYPSVGGNECDTNN
jgi:hypothetical protein